MSTRMFELHFTLPENLLKGRLEYNTRVRVFDAKSYHWSRLLVRENSFGGINRNRFYYLELANGIKHEFDSDEVASAYSTKKDAKYFILRRRNPA